MKNLVIGIKLLGLYFLVLGFKSLVQYSLMYQTIKAQAQIVEWNNIFPYLLEYGVSILIACVFIFKAKIVAKIIHKDELCEYEDAS